MDCEKLCADICYKRNFLKQVICKINFTETINKINESQKLDEALVSVIREHLPFYDRREVIQAGVMINVETPTEQRCNTKKLNQFNFYNEGQKIICIIESNAITLIYKEYKDFKVLYEKITKILSKFLEIYGEVGIGRLGLRYINEIELIETNFFNWKRYLSPKILGFLNVTTEKEEIIRTLNRIELKKTNHNLTFQYGMNNPDYPAKIKRKNFILDFDAYCGCVLYTDVEEVLNDFHDSIQTLFEECITDKMREVLNDD